MEGGKKGGGGGGGKAEGRIKRNDAWRGGGGGGERAPFQFSPRSFHD